MKRNIQRRWNGLSLVVLALGFVAAVIASDRVFQGWRIDLTENRLYTLTEGTERILDNLEEPLHLYFYFSDRATRNIPALRDYAGRIQEVLEEFEDAARGNLILDIIDPLPFSEDEDRAVQFGLQGVPLASSPDPAYMGLAGKNSSDGVEVIRFFQPDKEAFLEYDIAKLVVTLATVDKPVIGLVSDARIAGGFEPRTQQIADPWVIYQQVEQLFELRNLGTDFVDIPDDVSVLWIVQPKNTGAATLYAIDQFVMRGGTALIFVDPLAESDPLPPEMVPTQYPAMGQYSDLPVLFKAWGIEFSSNDVVADAQLALQAYSDADQRPVRHFGYLGITSDELNGDDVLTANLDTINMATAGYFEVAESGSVTIEPLITSSTSAALLPSTEFIYLPDPSTLHAGFEPTGQKYTLAARFNGDLPSAFPSGPPERNADAREVESNDESRAVSRPHLVTTVSPANLIVVGDVDMLTNQMWVRLRDFFGQNIPSPVASNGAFVINALDNLSGNSDLISVRSRANYSRPFTRVDKLRVEAETRFRLTEQRLQNKLAETERNLLELQSAREDTGGVLWTDEQQDEIDWFLNQRASIRQELRAVQRNLDKDINQLGAVLKNLNIVIVPFLLTVLVLASIWRRRWRR